MCSQFVLFAETLRLPVHSIDAREYTQQCPQVDRELRSKYLTIVWSPDNLGQCRKNGDLPTGGTKMVMTPNGAHLSKRFDVSRHFICQGGQPLGRGCMRPAPAESESSGGMRVEGTRRTAFVGRDRSDLLNGEQSVGQADAKLSTTDYVEANTEVLSGSCLIGCKHGAE